MFWSLRTMGTANGIGRELFTYPARSIAQVAQTNVRGPTFILVTQFTLKIKLIAFLNERDKVSFLRLEGQFTTHVTAGVRMI